MTPETVHEMLALYDGGQSLSAIATALGICTSSVRWYLRRRDGELPDEEPMRLDEGVWPAGIRFHDTPGADRDSLVFGRALPPPTAIAGASPTAACMDAA